MRIFGERRARLLFFGCLVVAGYFSYVAISGAIHNRRLADERDNAAEQVAVLKDKKAYLEGVRNYVSSDAYVEQQARRQLGYIREGEIPFVVISPALPNNSQQPIGEWWQRLFPR